MFFVFHIYFNCDICRQRKFIHQIMKKAFIATAFLVFAFNGTAQKQVVRVESQAQEIKEEVQVLKRKVAIARFSNETQYAKGLFYDKDNDPIGKQAIDILTAKLSPTNKFILL